MFTLSVTKILLTLAVGLFVWGFYRVLVRRRALPELGLKTWARAALREAIRPKVSDHVVSLVRCGTCGDHVSAGIGCSRADCPIAT